MHTAYFLATQNYGDPTTDPRDTRDIPGIRIVITCQAVIPQYSVVNMSKKRPRNLPTGCTPKQKEKRRELEVASFRRKKLSFTSERSWSDLECSALVEFIIITKGGQVWPLINNLISGNLLPGILYNALALKYNTQVRVISEIFPWILITVLSSSGLACRSKVTRDFPVNFPLHFLPNRNYLLSQLKYHYLQSTVPEVIMYELI